MRYQEVEIAGEQYPCRFGFNALSEFCKLTGLKLQELDKIGQDIDLEQALSLIFCGLKDGHRVKNKDNNKPDNFNLTKEDVADLIDEDWSVMEKVFKVFEEMMSSKKKAQKPMPKASKPQI